MLRSLSPVIVCLAVACSAADSPKDGDPFAACKDKYPDGGRAAYLKLLEARKVKEPEDDLKKLLLPGMVRITTEKRQEENVRPTEDLNVPSFVEEFEPKVIFVHKLSEDVYRIQTLSSCIAFVQTKSGGWLICQYLEGPIK